MILLVLVILIVLWFLGYGPIQAFTVNLFELNGHQISLWDLLIFLAITSLVGILPSPFKQIAVVAVILYILSLLGIFVSIAGISSLIVLAVIGGLILYVLRLG